MVHIIMAITPTWLADKDLIMHGTQYHTEVLNKFMKYQSEAIVTIFDSLLQLEYYYHLKMDACGYHFVDDRIVKDPVYTRMAWGGPNFIEELLSEIEAFSLKANFRKFYNEHLNYYDNLSQVMEEQSPIQKQWDWLEEQFTMRYDHYRIIFSPLVSANHSTNSYIQNDFKQTAMFVCGPIDNEQLSKEIKEGLMTRVIFTEIDHNYVTPATDRYLREVDIALQNIDKWVNEKSKNVYDTPYSVFNEYMTWAVFTAYLSDYFSKDYFGEINNRVEKQMTERRGFYKFSEFNTFFMNLYINKSKDVTIELLYPQLIYWFANQ
ncbi:MAG TPA: DUF4932 domain-containing protein [Saprospiraceae bacterium]|nr:DUF4932 domain-containing protein [Saprospiraceae bacterium]